MTPEEKNLLNFVHDEFDKGRIVLHTLVGLVTVPLDELIDQPATGLLYDLNKLEEAIPMNRYWVNNFATTKIIRELKRRLDEKETEA